jgi:hypothetical protein
LAWLLDAAILDWTQMNDLRRDQLRDQIITAFDAALLAAQQTDPKITITLEDRPA